MKRVPLIIALALAAGAAQAAPPMSENPPSQTSQCLDVSGALLPVSCKLQGSRTDEREVQATLEEMFTLFPKLRERQDQVRRCVSRQLKAV